jgi:hypothetical protein
MKPIRDTLTQSIEAVLMYLIISSL